MVIHCHHRCRFCGAVLPAWLPAVQRPNGALLIGHVSQRHPDQIGPYLARMRTACITTVVLEASVPSQTRRGAGTLVVPARGQL